MDCVWIICYEWVIFTGLCVLCIGARRGGEPCSVNIWLRVSLWLAVSIVWSLWRAAGMLSRVCQQFSDEQRLIEADVLHYWICHLYLCCKIFQFLNKTCICCDWVDFGHWGPAGCFNLLWGLACCQLEAAFGDRLSSLKGCTGLLSWQNGHGKKYLHLALFI